MVDVKHVIGVIALIASVALGEVFLPGTQPKEHGIRFRKVKLCRTCHGRTGNGDADPFFSWQGGMMAQAARDPVYRAAQAIANQDVAGIGEFCIRCHSPAGWIEGRSTPADGSALVGSDMDGLQCDVCHRLVDPRIDAARKLVEHVPPGYGNGMIVVDPERVVRGPYGDGPAVKSHKQVKSEFHAGGHLCGICHNVSNPLQATDVRTQPPHKYGHVERTYSEWLLSDYPAKGREGSCQGCHYPVVPGGGKAARNASAAHRDHFVTHGPVGGSTWVQEATLRLWGEEGMNREALESARERALALLKTAATLGVTFTDADTVTIRITNETGHKLPTGYPEGRRMWLNVRFLGKDGKVLEERGKYDVADDTLAGEPVSIPTLLDPERTRVYESLPGLSDEQAAKHGKQPGKSFHFVLNDVITKDNRIPPRGFSNAKFAEHQCQPVGAVYADGQHWDDVIFALPAGTVSVAVRLLYQSVSWEYMKFLVEENRTDDWSRRLYDVYNRTDHCPPTVIAGTNAPVQ